MENHNDHLPVRNTLNDTAASAAPVSTEPPQRQKSKKAIILLLIIACIAVMGGIVYAFMQTPKPSPSGADPLANATKFESPSALVDQADPGLKGKVLQVAAGDGVGSFTSEGYGVYSAPSYQPQGSQFSVLPESATGSGYSGDFVAAQSNYDKLKQFFATHKFRQITETKGGLAPVSPFENGSLVAYATYESQDILCAIRHVDGTQTSMNAHVSSIGCAQKQSYDEARRALQPFYDLYIEGSKEPVSGVTMGGLSRKDGVDRYQRAVVYIEDSTLFKEDEESMNHSISALYYKKPSSEKWTYFTGLEGNPGALYCSRYDNADVVKAYSGFTCYDEKTQKASIVR